MTNFRIAATILGSGFAASAALAISAVAAHAQIAKVEILPAQLETAAGRAAAVAKIERVASRLCYEPGMGNRQSNKACAERVTEQMLQQLGGETFAQGNAKNSVRVAGRR